MNKHLLILWACLFLLGVCLFDQGEGFRFLRGRRRQQHQQYERPSTSIKRINEPRQVLSRQGPLSGLLAGPLVLATFLFALPLLPSLVMAPLAIAGIPPALNVISNFVTPGAPNALSSFLAHFQDPLQTAESSSVGISTKPISVHPQLEILKNIANMVRGAISKKHSPIRDIAMMNTVDKDAVVKPSAEEELMAELLTPLNSTSTSTTDTTTAITNLTALDSMLEPSVTTALDSLDNVANSNSIENTLDRSLRTLQNLDTVVTSIRNVYSVIRNGLRRYEITDTDCQSLIVCEIHQKIVSHNKLLKTFSLSAIDALRLEKHVESFGSLNDKSKQAIKFYIAAAKAGFADKDCGQVFENCPTLKSRSLKSLKNIFANRNFFRRNFKRI